MKLTHNAVNLVDIHDAHSLDEKPCEAHCCYVIEEDLIVQRQARKDWKMFEKDRRPQTGAEIEAEVLRLEALKRQQEKDHVYEEQRVSEKYPTFHCQFPGCDVVDVAPEVGEGGGDGESWQPAGDLHRCTYVGCTRPKRVVCSRHVRIVGEGAICLLCYYEMIKPKEETWFDKFADWFNKVRGY